MSVIEYLRCVFQRRHRYKPSMAYPGKETCTFCRHRRPLTGKSF